MARARSLSEFQTSFPDERSCAAFLFERRWPQGFVCPACGGGRAALLKSRAHTYECLGCGRSPTGTDRIPGSPITDTTRGRSARWPAISCCPGFIASSR